MKKPHSFNVPMFHANKDGTTCEQEVKVTLTSDFRFTVDQPKHMAEMPQVVPVQLTDDSVQSVKMRYEDFADRYSRWKLSLNGEKFLMLVANTGPVNHPIWGVKSIVGIGLSEVTRLANGDVNQRDGTPLAFTQSPILLPDTTEVRAKVDSLIASIQGAADLIEGIRQATTPDEAAQYLLSITDGWTRADPVQAELPLDHPPGVALATYEFIPAADLDKPPATAVVEDDDEL